MHSSHSHTQRVTPTPCYPGLPLLKSLYPSTAAPQSCELPNPTPPHPLCPNEIVALQRHTGFQLLLLFSIVHALVYRHFRWAPSQADFSKHESFPHNALLDLCAYTWGGPPSALFVVFRVSPVYITSHSFLTHLIHNFLT